MWERLRQWAYPAPFRIGPGAAGGWAAPLVLSIGRDLAELAERQEALLEALRSFAAQATASAPGAGMPSLSDSLVVQLSNSLYRLRRNVALLEERDDLPEGRKVARAVERMEGLLADKGIEIIDLTGQVYDEGRLDFEPLGPSEPTPGIRRKQISLCDLPLIKLDGRMIQRAKGLVARPA